jgi:hypothetical protein
MPAKCVVDKTANFPVFVIVMFSLLSSTWSLGEQHLQCSGICGNAISKLNSIDPRVPAPAIDRRARQSRRLIDRRVSKGDPVSVSLLVLAFEDEPSIERAVYSWQDSAADFADCLIEARNRRLGCRATATFDGKALKLGGFVSA